MQESVKWKVQLRHLYLYLNKDDYKESVIDTYYFDTEDEALEKYFELKAMCKFMGNGKNSKYYVSYPVKIETGGEPSAKRG
ncbi:MAG: hypothetical protein AB7V60_04435 [Candidatus Caldatribacteriota bacterium]